MRQDHRGELRVEDGEGNDSGNIDDIDDISKVNIVNIDDISIVFMGL